MNSILLLRYLIEAAEREGNLQYNNLLQKQGLPLTPNQCEVLLVLEEYAPLSLKELGDLLVCERKSPSRLVQSLVKKNLVCKSHAPDDHRRAVLILTDEGAALLKKIKVTETLFNQQLATALEQISGAETLIPLFLHYLKQTESIETLKQRFDLSEFFSE